MNAIGQSSRLCNRKPRRLQPTTFTPGTPFHTTTWPLQLILPCASRHSFRPLWQHGHRRIRHRGKLTASCLSLHGNSQVGQNVLSRRGRKAVVARIHQSSRACGLPDSSSPTHESPTLRDLTAASNRRHTPTKVWPSFLTQRRHDTEERHELRPSSAEVDKLHRHSPGKSPFHKAPWEPRPYKLLVSDILRLQNRPPLLKRHGCPLGPISIGIG